MSTNGLQCFRCGGSGSRLVREKIEKKRVMVHRPCKAFGETGVIMKTRRKNLDGSYRKKEFDSYPNFIRIGPIPLNIDNASISSTQYDEDLCYLVGSWKVFQKIDRHRYSTDDLVTSWVAMKACESIDLKAPYHADLGCGLGSVLFSVAWLLSDCISIGVEKQQTRYDLAMRSLRYNLGDYPNDQRRVQIIHSESVFG